MTKTTFLVWALCSNIVVGMENVCKHPGMKIFDTILGDENVRVIECKGKAICTFEQICDYVKQNPAPHENQRTEVNLYNRSIIFIGDRIVVDELLDLDGDRIFPWEDRSHVSRELSPGERIDPSVEYVNPKDNKVYLRRQPIPMVYQPTQQEQARVGIRAQKSHEEHASKFWWCSCFGR